MSDTVDIFEIGQPGVGLTEDDIVALGMCWRGEATPHQQRVALEAVIDKLARADFLSYQAGSFDESAFLAGRSFVGKQMRIAIFKMFNNQHGETQ